jgi:predicted Zn-dependent peptidase
MLTLWPAGHPYHLAYADVETDIRSVGVDVVLDFWSRYCRPSNMVLVIVGDVDTE